MGRRLLLYITEYTYGMVADDMLGTKALGY